MAWTERYFDKEKECMSRDEMTALQSERLVKQVANVYHNVAFYNKKMKELGIEPGDIKGIEDINKLPLTTKAGEEDYATAEDLVELFQKDQLLIYEIYFLDFL